MAFYYDLAMLALWPIVALYNRQAFLMYFLLVYYTFLFAVFDTNFTIFIFASIAFCTASISKINLLSDFRKALLLHGVIYYVLAIDEILFYHFSIVTYLIDLKFWLIAMIDVYIAYTLMKGGGNGWKYSGMVNILDFRRVYALLLRKTIKNHHKARTGTQ